MDKKNNSHSDVITTIDDKIVNVCKESTDDMQMFKLIFDVVIKVSKILNDEMVRKDKLIEQLKQQIILEEFKHQLSIGQLIHKIEELEKVHTGCVIYATGICQIHRSTSTIPEQKNPRELKLTT